MVDLIMNAERNRANCDSPDFYSRRLEGYGQTLNVLTSRITESFLRERLLILLLINKLHVLANYLNDLRNNFEVQIENFERRDSVQSLSRIGRHQEITLFQLRLTWLGPTVLDSTLDLAVNTHP